MQYEDSYKIIRNIFIVISVLAGIMAGIIGWQAKKYYEYYKYEKLLSIKGNIEGYRVNTLDNLELEMKLKGYTCTFYFEIDDSKFSWDDLEKESGINKDCEIKILLEDKKRLQNMGVNIQQLKIGEKEYISWKDMKRYYHKSVYECIFMACMYLSGCIFFIYLATGKRYEKLTW